MRNAKESLALEGLSLSSSAENGGTRRPTSVSSTVHEMISFSSFRRTGIFDQKPCLDLTGSLLPRRSPHSTATIICERQREGRPSNSAHVTHNFVGVVHSRSI